jgi:hypothetical protein
MAVGLICLPPTAGAWDWKLTPYLWAAGIDGSAAIGPLEADMSADFEDLVNVLRGGGLLRLEANNGRHGVFGDLVYLRLRDKDARETVGGSLQADLDALIAEAAYLFRFADTYALEVGVRHWEFDTRLSPALLPAVENDSSWTDAFIGFRSEVPITPNWDWLFRANVGGGGSDYAAGLQMDFRRKFRNGNSLDIGLRILDFAYQRGSGLSEVELDMSIEGLTVGYTFGL